jgi:hypothetical protein
MQRMIELLSMPVSNEDTSWLGPTSSPEFPVSWLDEETSCQTQILQEHFRDTLRQESKSFPMKGRWKWRHAREEGLGRLVEQKDVDDRVQFLSDRPLAAAVLAERLMAFCVSQSTVSRLNNRQCLVSPPRSTATNRMKSHTRSMPRSFWHENTENLKQKNPKIQSIIHEGVDSIITYRAKSKTESNSCGLVVTIGGHGNPK